MNNPFRRKRHYKMDAEPKETPVYFDIHSRTFRDADGVELATENDLVENNKVYQAIKNRIFMDTETPGGFGDPPAHVLGRWADDGGQNVEGSTLPSKFPPARPNSDTFAIDPSLQIKEKGGDHFIGKRRPLENGKWYVYSDRPTRSPGRDYIGPFASLADCDFWFEHNPINLVDRRTCGTMRYENGDDPWTAGDFAVWSPDEWLKAKPTKVHQRAGEIPMGVNLQDMLLESFGLQLPDPNSRRGEWFITNGDGYVYGPWLTEINAKAARDTVIVAHEDVPKLGEENYWKVEHLPNREYVAFDATGGNSSVFQKFVVGKPTKGHIDIATGWTDGIEFEFHGPFDTHRSAMDYCLDRGKEWFLRRLLVPANPDAFKANQPDYNPDPKYGWRRGNWIVVGTPTRSEQIRDVEVAGIFPSDEDATEYVHNSLGWHNYSVMEVKPRVADKDDHGTLVNKAVDLAVASEDAREFTFYAVEGEDTRVRVKCGHYYEPSFPRGGNWRQMTGLHAEVIQSDRKAIYVINAESCKSEGEVGYCWLPKDLSGAQLVLFKPDYHATREIVGSGGLSAKHGLEVVFINEPHTQPKEPDVLEEGDRIFGRVPYDVNDALQAYEPQAQAMAKGLPMPDDPISMHSELPAFRAEDKPSDPLAKEAVESMGDAYLSALSEGLSPEDIKKLRENKFPESKTPAQIREEYGLKEEHMPDAPFNPEFISDLSKVIPAVTVAKALEILEQMRDSMPGRVYEKMRAEILSPKPVDPEWPDPANNDNPANVPGTVAEPTPRSDTSGSMLDFDFATEAQAYPDLKPPSIPVVGNMKANIVYIAAVMVRRHIGAWHLRPKVPLDDKEIRELRKLIEGKGDPSVPQVRPGEAVYVASKEFITPIVIESVTAYLENTNFKGVLNSMRQDVNELRQAVLALISGTGHDRQCTGRESQFLNEFRGKYKNYNEPGVSREDAVSEDAPPE